MWLCGSGDGVAVTMCVAVVVVVTMCVIYRVAVCVSVLCMFGVSV